MVRYVHPPTSSAIQSCLCELLAILKTVPNRRELYISKIEYWYIRYSSVGRVVHSKRARNSYEVRVGSNPTSVCMSTQPRSKHDHRGLLLQEVRAVHQQRTHNVVERGKLLGVPLPTLWQYHLFVRTGDGGSA